MLAGIDHLVLLVRDLQDGRRAYEELGFSVTLGGEHPLAGTHNALLPFTDGSYVEIIAFKEPDRPHDNRWWTHLATGGGLIDYALTSDDLAGDVARLAGQGLPFDLVDGRRMRPDGQEIAWRMAQRPGSRRAQPPAPGAVPLPFLIEDVTPRSLRVPEGTARAHRNGVGGLAAVYVAVDDLERAGKAYGALLETAVPPPTPDERFGADGLAFPCAQARIVLLERAALAGRLPANIGQRGPGIVAAALRSGRGEGTRRLDVGRARSAVLFM